MPARDPALSHRRTVSGVTLSRLATSLTVRYSMTVLLTACPSVDAHDTRNTTTICSTKVIHDTLSTIVGWRPLVAKWDQGQEPGDFMATRRGNGEGTIRQRSDGR